MPDSRITPIGEAWGVHISNFNSGAGGNIFANKDGNGDMPLVVGGPISRNSITGPIRAEAAMTSKGEDGQYSSFVALRDGGKGGINLQDARISTKTTTGTPGTILASAPDGKITLPAHLSNDGEIGSPAGFLALDAKTMSASAVSRLTASSAGGSDGGQIWIATSKLDFAGDFSMEAKGAKGGYVVVGSPGSMSVSLTSEGYKDSLSIDMTVLPRGDLSFENGGKLAAVADGTEKGGAIVR